MKRREESHSLFRILKGMCVKREEKNQAPYSNLIKKKTVCKKGRGESNP